MTSFRMVFLLLAFVMRFCLSKCSLSRAFELKFVWFCPLYFNVRILVFFCASCLSYLIYSFVVKLWTISKMKIFEYLKRTQIMNDLSRNYAGCSQNRKYFAQMYISIMWPLRLILFNVRNYSVLLTISFVFLSGRECVPKWKKFVPVSYILNSLKLLRIWYTPEKLFHSWIV